MTRLRSRRPRSVSKSDVTRSDKTVAELEAELSELRAAMELQKRELEENSASCSQAIARVSHSERTLSQAKAKLVAADELAQQAGAQVITLSASLHEAVEQLQRFADERAAQAERERELTEGHEQALRQVEQQAAEMASLRDAL